MPAETDKKSPECKTVVTRAEFEKIVNTLAPNIPADARQRLAQDYSQMLVLSDQAKKKGLDKTQRYEDILTFMKMRILAQEYLTNLQETSKPSAADVEKYHQDNKAKYEELTLNRLFIPRNKPAPANTKDAEPKPLTEAEVQAQGEKFRARLVAGEGFEKLQKEAYEAAGFKTPPPPILASKRREGVPPAEQELFQLKTGEFSKVIVDAAGASIYQVQGAKEIPFDQVKPGIEAQLASEHLRRETEAVRLNPPELNEAYFRSFKSSEPARATMPQMPPPQGSSSNNAKPSTPPAPKTTPKSTGTAKPKPALKK